MSVIHSRFAKYFVVGSVLEMVRMISFHLLLNESGSTSLESNFYSLLLSLIVGFPLMAKFIWPDRGGATVGQVARYITVWLLALGIKLPLLGVISEPCPSLQVSIDAWAVNFPMLWGLGTLREMFFSCVNLTTAAMDFFIAIGLKYILFDRLVFIKPIVLKSE